MGLRRLELQQLGSQRLALSELRPAPARAKGRASTRARAAKPRRELRRRSRISKGEPIPSSIDRALSLFLAHPHTRMQYR